MRHFYGMNRTLADAPPDCGVRWTDNDEIGRIERAEMLDDLCPGDVVVVRARGDLGRGAEINKVERQIAERGATVEVVPFPQVPKRRGRPCGFNPTPEQDAAIRGIWHSFVMKKAALAEARAIYPGASWDQLRRRYGNRWEK